jgi:phosphoglycerate dehydrogenase-like enzyme
VLAVTLALFRRLPLAVERQRQHVWAQDEIGAPAGNRRLAGSRVLIVGAGSIGRAAAVRLQALGARVTGIRRNTEGPLPAGFESMLGADALAGALPDADVVLIAAPQTAVTRGLIGERELALMRRDAVIVNVSRGGLIDETALVDALRAGRVAGAALDVFRKEPLTEDSALWDVPNLLITPHTSGFRHDHWDAAVDLFAENLRRFEAGEPLINVVDKRAGY